MSTRNATALLLLTVFSTLPVSAQSARTLRLNGKANEGIIEDNGNPNDNILQLRSTNNTFNTIRFEQPTDRLTLLTYGGDDDILVSANLDCSLVIKGGRGNDTTRLGEGPRGPVISGDVRIVDENGNNTVNLSAATINGHLTVVDGNGFQTVFAQFARIVGNVRVNSPDGGSAIDIQNSSQVTGKLLVNNAGYGNDRFGLNRTSVGRDCLLEFGNGDLDLSSAQAGAGSFKTRVGSGVTDIFVAELISNGDVHFVCEEGSTKLTALSPLIRGQLLVKSGLGFDEVLVGALQPLTNGESVDLNIETGDGGSDITIQSAGTMIQAPRTIVDDVTILTGSGSDLLTVSFENVGNDIGLLSYETGSGNSSLLVEDLTPELASQLGDVQVLHRGGGFDNLTIDSATIDGDLLFTSGWGGSDIDLSDAVILGKTDLTSNGSRVDHAKVTNTLFGDFNLATANGNSYVTVKDSTFLGDFVSTGGRNFDKLRFRRNTVGGLYYTEGYEVVIE